MAVGGNGMGIGQNVERFNEMSASGKAKNKKTPNTGYFGGGPKGTASKPPMSREYLPKSR